MVEHVDHISWLKERLAEFEARLTEAEATVARLRPIVSNLQGSIAALTAPEPGRVPTATLFDSVVGPQPMPVAAPTEKPQRAARGSRLPLLQARFAGMSTAQVAREILSRKVGPLHADDITRTIFVCRTAAEFQSAKHTVVAALSRDAKKGLLTQLGGNRYALKQPATSPGEAAASN